MDKALDWGKPRQLRRATFKVSPGKVSPGVPRPTDFAVRSFVVRRKFWLVGAPMAALVLLNLALLFVPSQFYAQIKLAIERPAGGILALRANQFSARSLESSRLKLLSPETLSDEIIDPAQLAERPEFDKWNLFYRPLQKLLSLAGYHGIFFENLIRDYSWAEFQSRLKISVDEKSESVSIGFYSEDRSFANEIAHKASTLFLRLEPEAKIVAIDLPRQIGLASKKTPLLILGSSSVFFLVLTVLLAWEWLSHGAPVVSRSKVEQPLSLNEITVFTNLPETPARALSPPTEISQGPEFELDMATAQILSRIKAASWTKADPHFALRIVTTSCDETSAAPARMIALARQLAREKRAILLDLDGSDPEILAQFATVEELLARRNRSPVLTKATADAPYPPGLSDLLSGQASFAEVIRRDPASRLHFVLAGQDPAFDLSELGLVLNALAETYDYIILMAAALDLSETAARLAAETDIMVLTMPKGNDHLVGTAYQNLHQAGAKDILVVGVVNRLGLSLAQDVA